jgi:hypothetical protein
LASVLLQTDGYALEPAVLSAGAFAFLFVDPRGHFGDFARFVVGSISLMGAVDLALRRRRRPLAEARGKCRQPVSRPSKESFGEPERMLRLY